MAITKIRDIPARNYFNYVPPSGSGTMKCLKVLSVRLYETGTNRESCLQYETLYWQLTKWNRDTRETTQFGGINRRLIPAPTTRRKPARLKRSVASASQKQEESGLPANIKLRTEEEGKKTGTLLGIPVTFQVVYKVTRKTKREEETAVARAGEKNAPSLPGPLFRSRSIIRRCTKETDEIVTRCVVTHSRVAGEIH